MTPRATGWLLAVLPWAVPWSVDVAVRAVTGTHIQTIGLAPGRSRRRATARRTDATTRDIRRIVSSSTRGFHPPRAARPAVLERFFCVPEPPGTVVELLKQRDDMRPRNFVVTGFCTSSGCGKARASARMYFRLREEDPRTSGKASLKSRASRSTTRTPRLAAPAARECRGRSANTGDQLAICAGQGALPRALDGLFELGKPVPIILSPRGSAQVFGHAFGRKTRLASQTPITAPLPQKPHPSLRSRRDRTVPRCRTSMRTCACCYVRRRALRRGAG
ncbi:hypothetical protein OKW49_007826 [Paraburkholderia youngii]